VTYVSASEKRGGGKEGGYQEEIEKPSTREKSIVAKPDEKEKLISNSRERGRLPNA